MGVSYDIPGMGYKNPQTGAIEGFEPDLARAIAVKLLGSGDRVDFVQVTDDQRIQALQDDRVDCVVSQLTITADRAEQVAFTVPYWVTEEAILVRKGSGIHGFEDLAGKRIAATAGSVSIRRMRASLASLPGTTLVETPLSAGNLEAVARGDADAASNDRINLTCLKDASPHPDDFEIIAIGERFDPKPFGIAVKKGRLDLVNLLNEAIESLQMEGAIERLMDAAMAGIRAPATSG
ncbi:transporter substrate-binding domain-containing protein [Synechococcus sp. CCY9201]|uniref:transporter substrate-binding domain-containing protein n=1 Tax=Synechococcus sp. CCY9201 TaxID=174697 RepID=UPI002B210F89|nr:transporter substrate-binding domain-containing protein [Synechococcus sp. CCY9201]MEA5472826.1 transporter substrate-binding domain-containing protein [Synechococcus sp. CCY9201]